MYNLFAILRDGGVARIPLDRESQITLSNEFESQAEAFLHDDRERHEYAPGFVPTDGGIVELKFKLPPELSRLSPTIPNDVPSLSRSQVLELDAKALVAVGEGQFCFQALDKSRYLGPKRLAILFNANANQVKALPGIVLGEKLEAVHQAGKLYFISETVVRRFLDLDSVFRAATNDEIVEVLSAGVFAPFEPTAVLEISDTWARRKIMVIKESQILTTTSLAQFQRAATACNVRLPMSKGKILIPIIKKELKQLLKFLSEDFLASPIRPTTIFEVTAKRPRK